MNRFMRHVGRLLLRSRLPVLILLLGPLGGRAAETSEPPPLSKRIKETDIPVGQIRKWTEQGWKAVSRDEYDTLKAAADSSSEKRASAWIERAEYSATVVGGMLQDGLLEATIVGGNSINRLLPLDPLNLVLSDLKWLDQSTATWGTTPSHRRVLLLDRRAGTIHSRWNFKGRSFSNGYRFDIQVAPAAVSRLLLRVPDGLVLTSTQGEVFGPSRSGQNGWQQWRVELGSETACRLNVTPMSQGGTRKPLIFATGDVSNILRPDGIQVQAVFDLEIIESSIRQLDCLIPSDIKINSVTYGRDTNVVWTSKIIENDQHLIIDLPDALLGRSRPLRIDGFTPAPVESTWTLPSLSIKDATFLSGHLHLQVESPLELQSFERIHGFGHVSTITNNPQGDSFTFQRYLDDAQIVVRTGRARLDLAAQVLNHLDTTAQDWRLISQIDWSAHSGSTYSARCILPPQWQTVEVAPASPNSTPQISHWDIQRSKDGSRVLVVEFMNALSPDDPKSIRIVNERTPAANNQPAALPIMQPQDCRSVTSVLVVSYSSTMIPHLDAKSLLESSDEAGLPDFVHNSALWKAIKDDDANRMLLLIDPNADPEAGLTIDNSEPSFNAEAKTTFYLKQQEFRETFVARVNPKTEPVSRVFIYLSTSGIQPSWNVLDETRVDVTASRIPLSQHSEWNVPATGELWELRFDHPLKDKFRIITSRTGTVATSTTPALMFVPGAKNFNGTLHLHISRDVEVDISANKLSPLENSENTQITPELENSWSSRYWNYETPASSLLLRIMTESSTVQDNRFATLYLQTILNASGRNADIHRAEYYIAEEASHGLFRFRIPEPSSLLAVRVNGNVVAPSREGDEFTLPPFPQLESNLVEVQFRSPSLSGLFTNTRRIPLPIGSHKILHFDWEIAFPADLRFSFPDQLIASDNRVDAISWSERFFGPIGRPQEEKLFNPFSRSSWRNFLDLNRAAGEGDVSITDSSFPPNHFLVAKLRGPMSVNTLALRTWSQSRMETLGWTVLLLCASIGFVLKLRNVYPRVHLVAGWFGFLFVVTLLASPVWIQITGGTLAGSLLGLFMPRNVLRLWQQKNIASDGIPLGSTVSYRPSSASLLLVLSSAAALTVVRHLPAQQVNQPQERPRSVYDPYTVLIPAEQRSDSKTTTPVVYLSKTLSDDLQREAKRRSAEGAYLISSADYDGKVEDGTIVSIEAKYRIAVLAAAPVTRVVLPISNANLGGVDACLVNGKPHPVLLDVGGTGYILQLTDHENDAPVVAPKPQSLNSKPLLPRRVRMFDVVLRMHPAVSPIPGGAHFELKLPSAAVSRLELVFDKNYVRTVVSGSEGIIPFEREDRKVVAQMARTDELDILWSTAEEPMQTSPTLEARVSCLVEAHPNWLEYNYHVDYRVVGNHPVDFVTWNIPELMVVRKIGGETDRLPYSTASTPGESTLVYIDLKQPQTGSFTVDASLIYPLESSGLELQVPALDILEKSVGLKILMNQIGITTRSEFLLTAKTIENDRLARISAESFTSEADDQSFRVKRPLVAYRLQEEARLSFELTPVPTIRKVQQAQIGLVTGEGLKWSFSADVETSGQPAFFHTLLVDQNLRIESLSVQEDKAERLIRWSRDGEKIHLFLSDKTSGTQQVKITGQLPLQFPGTVPLPDLRLVDGKTTSSSLTLLSEPGLSVELSATKTLTPVEVDGKQVINSTRDQLVGRYEHDMSGPLPRIHVIRGSDHVRVDSATLVEKQKSGRWLVSTTLRFREATIRVPNIRVLLPADLPPDYHLDITNATSTRQARDDGSMEIILSPIPGAEKDIIASCSAAITAPTGVWKLPNPSAINATVGESYLLISPLESFFPEADTVSKLVPGTVPAWIGDSTSFDADSNTWDAYSGKKTAWSLKPSSSEVVEGEIRVPLIDTQCWLERDGSLQGLTEIFAISAGGHHLRLLWPAKTQLKAIYIDGHPTLTRLSSLGDLTFQIEPTTGPHAIVLAWSNRSDSSVPRLGALTHQIPRLADVSAERSLVSVIPPRGVRLFPREGMTQTESLRHSMLRLDGLLTTHWESGEHASLQTALWNLLIQTHDHCAKAFQAAGDSADWDDQTAKLHARFIKAGREIETLRGTVSLPASLPRKPLQTSPRDLLGLQEPFSYANQNLLMGELTVEGSKPLISFWVIDELPITIIMYAIGLIVLIFVVWKLAYKNFGKHGSLPPNAAWMLLGLLWWSFLANGALGLLLLLLACYRIGKQHRHEAGNSRSAQPA